MLRPVKTKNTPRQPLININGTPPSGKSLFDSTALSTAPLSEAEKLTLAQCESRIADGRQGFLDIANALETLREGQLYRDEFDTFEEYCREKWADVRKILESQ